MAQRPVPLDEETAGLAGDLPGILLEARRLAAAAPGAHGRRRAGLGEDFWQYRDHGPEDGARLVDWRQSARGERLFVKEREKQAAQSALFWVDPAPGFDWSGDADRRPTKKRRAFTILLAFATLLARGGERVGALGGAAGGGPRAVERLALALCAPPAGQGEPAPAPARSCVILASDGYAPIEAWTSRFQRLAAAGARGALLLTCDPAEEDFPFHGRVLFQEHEGGGRQALFGRAEEIRAAYKGRLQAHRTALCAAARALDIHPILHRTDHPAAPALMRLADALSDQKR